MKVLMFGWEFPPHITGGLGTACFGLVKGLARHNVQMIFVVPRLFGEEDQTYSKMLSASDVEINERNFSYSSYIEHLQKIEINSTLLPYVYPEDFARMMSSETEYIHGIELPSTFKAKYQFSGKYGTTLYEEVSRYAMIAEVIARENPHDIIHSHDWLTYPAGIAAKKASGKPLVIHVHATEFDRSGENVNQFVFDIEKKGMEEADRIITVSNLTRNIVIERYGISPDKVFTVHNAVEPVELKEIDQIRGFDEKLVTFLGRITYQKGPEYFIEAAHKVLKRTENVRFVMAGSGDMLNKMIRRTAQLRIGDRFHFSGFLKGDDVLRVFSMSDVYVMPSVSEPFGISPLEAMRSNVPVIISKQSGVSEILTHAIKVDFWDTDALADAIHALITYNGISDMFRKYVKTEVESLKWENAAYKVKEVYLSAL
ncbi:MAG: 4-alpha-glucanotransferase [Bacteroidetes bacterium HGW-Bacteroidetes-21]|nr:MAG: 4-alpha-glucanotransferase [Bacteroidetes bacterium HGW-Bacteroidetes-21]